VICCIDCLNFKMCKGWKFAYCSIGLMIYCSSNTKKKKLYKDRLFKWKGSNGRNLVERASQIQVLNHSCKVFNPA
jgi:hypothetical protein